MLVFHIDALQGGKHRRRGKDENDDERELVFRKDVQEYAQVTKMLGNGRLEAQYFDGEKRLAHIRKRWGKSTYLRFVASLAVRCASLSCLSAYSSLTYFSCSQSSQ